MSAVTFAAGTLGHEAEAYASRGIKVFPLWNLNGRACACKEAADCGSPGKHPRVGRGGLNLATNDRQQIGLWWAMWPDANIGIPTGANRIAVIDVDPGHGGDDTLATLVEYCACKGFDLMRTRTVRTGSGGLHLYFRDPFAVVKTASKSFGSPGVDTRGRGGYVVAPPSLHASGNRYELMPDSPAIAPWPGMLTALLDQPRFVATPAPDGLGPGRSATVSTAAGARWAAAGLAAECEALAAMRTKDSGRNNALNVAAYKVGRKLHLGGYTEEQAAGELYGAVVSWIGDGHTPREIEATIASGIRSGKMRPHPGPTTRGQ